MTRPPSESRLKRLFSSTIVQAIGFAAAVGTLVTIAVAVVRAVEGRDAPGPVVRAAADQPISVGQRLNGPTLGRLAKQLEPKIEAKAARDGLRDMKAVCSVRAHRPPTHICRVTPREGSGCQRTYISVVNVDQAGVVTEHRSARLAPKLACAELASG